MVASRLLTSTEYIKNIINCLSARGQRRSQNDQIFLRDLDTTVIKSIKVLLFHWEGSVSLWGHSFLFCFALSVMFSVLKMVSPNNLKAGQQFIYQITYIFSLEI